MRVGAVVGGAVPGTGETLAYRLAVQQYDSDGFRRNPYLGRDDTNQRDELSVRGKLRWQASDVLRVDFTGLHVDLDNGYDAFAIDNGFTTWSDQPGRDAQQTDAGALRISWQLGFAELLSITGLARSDMQFGFDADWGNPDYWAPYVYSFTQAFRSRARYRSTRNCASSPARTAGCSVRTGWPASICSSSTSPTRAAIRASAMWPPVATTCCSIPRASSDYSATSVALFSSVSRPLSDNGDGISGPALGAALGALPGRLRQPLRPARQHAGR